jgi:hypothetical protein
MRAAAERGCAYYFLSPDMLRSEGTGHSKGSRLKGWIESPNALRWRLDRDYAAPLPRQSREKLRTPHGSTEPRGHLFPSKIRDVDSAIRIKSGQDRNRSVKGFGQDRQLKLSLDDRRYCFRAERKQ